MKIKYKIGIIIFLILVIIGITYTATPNILYQDDTNNNLNSLSKSGNVSISVTGDVMFGRKMPSVLSSGESPFRYVSDVINKSDVLLVNFENPVTTSTTATKPDVPLKADPTYVNLLKLNDTNVIAAGANNHVYDYGATGLSDTFKYLNQANITHIGAGENKQQATAPAVIEQNGHNVAIFNYMDGNNFAEYGNDVMPKASDNSSGYSAWDPTESPKQIQNAKNNGSDFVLVYMHYGNEYSRSPNDDQKNISHTAIDAGADAVVGSHTHVTQGIEMYNGKPIFYNLGNFIFDQSNTATHQAYFVNFNIVKDTVHVTVYPIDLVGYLPHHMSATDGKTLLNELNPQCSDLKVTDSGTGELSYKIGNSTNDTK